MQRHGDANLNLLQFLIVEIWKFLPVKTSMLFSRVHLLWKCKIWQRKTLLQKSCNGNWQSFPVNSSSVCAGWNECLAEIWGDNGRALVPVPGEQVVAALCRHWQLVFQCYLLPMLPSPSCTASVGSVAETGKLKYLSRKPTSNRSAHPSLHWTCWDHRLQDSYQLRYPARTAPGECGHGSKHSAILQHQRGVGSTAVRAQQRDCSHSCKVQTDLLHK